MGIWLGPRWKTVITENDFSYSGNYLFKSDGKHWEMALLDGSAASLVFSKNPGRVDVFIVAGGESGKTGSGSAQYGPSNGGDGGKGGECVNYDNILMQRGVNYSVSIGNSDESTSLSGGALNYLARSGYGSSGGVGGTASQGGGINATAGTDGVFAYNKSSDTLMIPSFQGHKFGPGGGAGGAMIAISGLPGSQVSGALGGESNGSGNIYGAGAYSSVNGTANGSAGYANHGQGGGGAYRFWYYQSSSTRDGTPGTGGSGIIFIRDAR